jgi:hypothetical protein
MVNTGDLSKVDFSINLKSRKNCLRRVILSPSPFSKK